MSDNFDPDAWPSSGGQSRPTTAGQDDDYDAIAFDDDDDYDNLGALDDYEDDDLDTATVDLDTAAVAPKQPTAPTAPAAPAAPAVSPPKDDYDRLYSGDSYPDDDTGYDDYDDEDFDREPRQGAGIGRKLAGAFAVVALLGAIGFGASALLGNDEGGDNSGLQAIEESENAEQPENADVSEGEEGPAGEAATPPADVQEALDEALAAWGRFAVTGNLDDVRPHFVNDGPQFDRFLVEAPLIAADPPAQSPATMVMNGPQTVRVDDNSWIFKGIVTMTYPGDTPQNLPFEIRLVRQGEGQPWQIEHVRQY